MEFFLVVTRKDEKTSMHLVRKQQALASFTIWWFERRLEVEGSWKLRYVAACMKSAWIKSKFAEISSTHLGFPPFDIPLTHRPLSCKTQCSALEPAVM